MKRSSLLLGLFAAIFTLWQPAQAKPASTVGIGDALFGCTSVEYFGKLVDFAMHHQPRAFAEGLLSGVSTGKCVAFKSSQQVFFADTTTYPQLVQVKLADDGPGYWTSKKQLNGIKPPLPKNFGNVVTQLYTGKGKSQPLLVMLRGSGGGNDWATARYKDERAALLKQGYAILALGYFAGRHNGPSMKRLPRNLDRISLNGIHKAIVQAAQNAKVDGQ